MRSKFVGVCLATIVSVSAWAGLASAQECGPAYVVWDNNKGIVQQLLGLTTNGTLWPTHTVAITSGTSDCSNDGIIKRDVEQEYYVAANFDSLAADMARGNGQHLAAMAELMGCDVGLQAEFAQAMREEVEPFLAHWDTPGDAAAHLRTALATRPTLGGCTRLS